MSLTITSLTATATINGQQRTVGPGSNINWTTPPQPATWDPMVYVPPSDTTQMIAKVLYEIAKSLVQQYGSNAQAAIQLLYGLYNP